MPDIVENFIVVLRADEAAASTSSRITRTYRMHKAVIASKDKGSNETDEPWKVRGQSSQQPEQDGPPRREREEKD